MEAFHKDEGFCEASPGLSVFLHHSVMTLSRISQASKYSELIFTKVKYFFVLSISLKLNLCLKFHQCLRIFLKYLSLYPTITVHVLGWCINCQLSSKINTHHGKFLEHAALFSKHSVQILQSVGIRVEDQVDPILTCVCYSHIINM